MKLLTYMEGKDSENKFGLIINEMVISFDTIQKKFNKNYTNLYNMTSYLNSLPYSEENAEELFELAKNNLSLFKTDEKSSINQIKILPPIEDIPMLLDFGLSPKHLKNSAETMLKYETNSFLRPILKGTINLIYKRIKHKKNFRYYKCNHHSIIGQFGEVSWKPFTSFLDIEPELGIVVGYDNKKKKPIIAGYLIFNDVSARDVQLPEMLNLTGPSRSKDFDNSKGVGPFVVTRKEVENPLSLSVEVQVGNRYKWNGNTNEYVAHPEEVLNYLCSFLSVKAGTVIGMGTIPNCCGLDNDEWILPGEKIEITFDKLGTLVQFIPKNIGLLEYSRWGKRTDF